MTVRNSIRSFVITQETKKNDKKQKCVVCHRKLKKDCVYWKLSGNGGSGSLCLKCDRYTKPWMIQCKFDPVKLELFKGWCDDHHSPITLETIKCDKTYHDHITMLREYIFTDAMTDFEKNLNKQFK